MEPFLGDGETAGKIICPNKRCGAKLGNYDWAGVRCSCKTWVIPVSAVLLCQSSFFLTRYVIVIGFLYSSFKGR